MNPGWVIAALVYALLCLGATAGADSTASSASPQQKWFSQYGQDRFVYERFFATAAAEALDGTAGASKGGVFVELGAADGEEKSNTLAFERLLGWTGLLIEPSQPLFSRLRQTRPRCKCVNDCVARVAGHYSFAEDGLNSGFAAYSPGGDGASTDKGKAGGNEGLRFCRTLAELIDEHLGHVAHIDYLSLDTEGSELDILQSFDFRRHTVDVITVEVHDWRERIRAERLALLLHYRGFRFVERLVDDEVWVRRRGLWPDPGCLLPIAGLSEKVGTSKGISPHGGWAQARRILRSAHKKLASTISDGGSILPLRLHENLGRALFKLVHDFDEGHPNVLKQCPPGALTLGLIAALVRTRESSRVPADFHTATQELRKQTIFHPNTGILHLLQAYSRQDSVEEAEHAGARFDVRLPLGRAWHETTFSDALESGWPIFGLLDVLAQLSVSAGHLYEKVRFSSAEYHFPVRVPRLPCTLEVHRDGELNLPRVMLVQKTRGSGRGPRPSTQDAVLDTDACGLLGVAAARFHAARAFGQQVLLAGGKDRFVPLANWSTRCWQTFRNHTRGNTDYARDACRAHKPQACAAVKGQAQRVPRRCLYLQHQPGACLRVRRSTPLDGTQAAVLVQEGERLFREFVQRHGFFAALWASASQQLAPQSGTAESNMKAASAPVPGANVGETLFGVLDSLQQLMLGPELLA